jgi:hypothetical protein
VGASHVVILGQVLRLSYSIKALFKALLRASHLVILGQVFRLYEASMTPLLRLYQSSIKALLRLD